MDVGGYRLRSITKNTTRCRLFSTTLKVDLNLRAKICKVRKKVKKMGKVEKNHQNRKKKQKNGKIRKNGKMETTGETREKSV